MQRHSPNAQPSRPSPPRREHAVRWARQELDRERREEMEYRLRQDAPVARALEARGTHPDW